MARIIIATITVAITLALINQASAQAVNQAVTLYSGRDGGGEFKKITETYAPDLGNQQFDNRAQSACATGVWLFYENAAYNSQYGLMEYVFGPNNYCVNFQSVGGKVSSVRFAGHPKSYKTNTLTLFQGNYFQGTDEYTTVSLPNLSLDRQAASLIVTGSSAWTLYALPNYAGDSVCVYPPPSDNSTPAFIFDMANISIPNNSIRSVEIGCKGTRSVVATAFQANKLTAFSATAQNTDSTGAVHGFNTL